VAFVRIKSGGYLKDPTFMGDGWYIRCSEEEGLVMVIKSRAKTVKAVRARMRSILKESGVEAGLMGDGYPSTTAFPPNFQGLVASWKWTLRLHEPFDADEWTAWPLVKVGGVPHDATVFGEDDR
jgi:hypothetical protein